MKFISKINALFKVQKIKDALGAEVWIVSWDTVWSCLSIVDNGLRVAKAFLMKEDAVKLLQQAQKPSLFTQIEKIKPVNNQVKLF